MNLKEKVKRIQELRRSNAATPVRNKKKYTRKRTHKNSEYCIFMRPAIVRGYPQGYGAYPQPPGFCD